MVAIGGDYEWAGHRRETAGPSPQLVWWIWYSSSHWLQD